ncbi:prepilin peptidase [bacterium]|nr:prepilin peptidase [bacterium]
MEIYYMIVTFIFGAVLGSFYNVVGYRIPKGESLITPSSHCTKCNHKLGASELVPIFSWIFLGGKCKNCKEKISCFYPVFELSSGILFALSYHLFGFSIQFLISITFISMLLIIIISDYQTMIIPDEVLISSSIILLIEFMIKDGGTSILGHLLDGFVSFLLLFLLKKIGDFLFKKESMGGGDLKLMAVIGMVLGWKVALICIFLASFIGLPISLIILFKNKTDIIPFGPFLSVSAIILFLLQLDFQTIITFLTF